MVNFITYPNSTNITSFPAALDYSAQVFTAAGLAGVFFPILYLGFFLIFFAIGIKLNGERAILIAGFLEFITGVFMVSANLLDPLWLIITGVAFIAALFIWGSKG